MKNFTRTRIRRLFRPPHLKANQAFEGNLLVAYDPNDSVGMLDSYFLQAAFFKKCERLDRRLEKLRRGTVEDRVHFVSICSPNHLHNAHIRQALRTGANAICENRIYMSSKTMRHICC